MFNSVQALLFDFDGTLVRPSIDFDEMRTRVLDVVASFGVGTHPLERMHVLELIARVTAELGDGSPAATDLCVRTDQVILEIELEAAAHTRPYNGVPEMLSELGARGYGVGIVTRNCRAAVEIVLAHHPLYHQILLTRDDVEHVKPDPRHLLSALDVLRIDRTKALMCGDHPMDVLAGQRIGARTVGVLAPGVGPERFAEVRPDLVLDDVTQIMGHLDHR